MFLVVKCKDKTREILHHGSEEEGDRHGKEDGKDHSKRFVGIQQIPELQSPVRMGYFNQSNGYRTAE